MRKEDPRCSRTSVALWVQKAVLWQRSRLEVCNMMASLSVALPERHESTYSLSGLDSRRGSCSMMAAQPRDAAMNFQLDLGSNLTYARCP
jgi:hypothetical protein